MKTTSAESITPLIRIARMEELDAINTIYNHYVLQSTCTYQEAPESMEDRRKWFAHHDAPQPVSSR